MTEKLGLSADEVLTTTRSVRKRLDLTRPVPREVLVECIEIAHQSPTGSNSQRWRWMIIEDADKRRAIADIYRANFEAAYKDAPPYEPGSQSDRVNQSAQHLAAHLHEVPVHVIPLLADRMGEGVPSARQASRWGGILPAVWSFMLALRERGLGSAWTSLHLANERDVAELLGIPYDEYSQAGLYPVAYTIGTDFKPARRPPAEEFIRWNEWS
jgi:nitroreductase